MGIYSTEAEISDFLQKLGPRPLCIYDGDGNSFISYRLREGRTLPLGAGDNPKNQSIPFGLTQRQLASLVENGLLEKDIFAGKTMDVRLPSSMVDFINQCTRTNEPFRIAFLTSRSEFEAKKILEESGVENVDQVTLIADSGATLNIQGKQTLLRPLSPEEDEYRRGLDNIAKELQPQVNAIVRRHMGEDAKLPDLYVEHKGIGSNIHWREILDANGQGDESALDHELGELLRARIIAYGARSPEASGEKIFKTLDGPATMELKIASVNKGIGLSLLLDNAAAHHTPPSSFMFSGDDYSKGNGHPGTDYFAALETDRLSIRHGIPGFNVQTLHPKEADIHSMEPELSRMVNALHDAYEKPLVHLILRTPEETASLVLRAYGVAPEKKFSLAASNWAPALNNP